MLYFAENSLIEAIGTFGVIGAVNFPLSITGGRYRSGISINSGINSSSVFPGQCQVFLTSSKEFIWFVEQWDIIPKIEAETSFDIPLVTLENKKVYPAKVQGLSLALLGNSDVPLPVTVQWRDGLIRHSSYAETYYDSTIPCLRPGFGEMILQDLERPLQSETVTTNNLGLMGATANSTQFWGPLGRLMSMAFHVDPDLAKAYDDSKNKKKKKSLNEQDYQQMPEYPPYTPYVDNSGY